jgi:membrane protein DedA with SNARE-associated domain
MLVCMKPGTLLVGVAVAALGVVRRERLTRPAAAALVVVVAGLLIAGSGLVALPPIPVLVRDATSALGPFTLVVVGAFAFAESGAFVGLVAPGELIVVLGGVAAGHGTVALVTLIAVVWICALAGDLVSYAIGRRRGREVLLRHGAALGVTDVRLRRVESFLADHGAKTILVGRFIGVVRALAPFLAGASGMAARRFVPVAVLASGVWAATFSGLGYLFWSSLDTLITVVERGSLALALIAAAFVLVRRRRRGPARSAPSAS